MTHDKPATDEQIEKYRAICAEIPFGVGSAIIARIDALKAENARLREDKQMLIGQLHEAADVMSTVMDSECPWEYSNNGNLPKDPTIVSSSALAELIIHHRFNHPNVWAEMGSCVADGTFAGMDYCDALRLCIGYDVAALAVKEEK